MLTRRVAAGITTRRRRVLVEIGHSQMRPRYPGGDFKSKLFQRLTEDIGQPKLRERLVAVLMLMKYPPQLAGIHESA
jgi:hypothetical protein